MNDTITTIQVKPIIVNEGGLGLEKYGFSRFPNTGLFIQPLVDPHTKKRNTGLTSEQEKRLGEIVGEDLTAGSPYWDSYNLRLTDTTLVLNTKLPFDEINLAILKQHPYVANSETEHKEGKWPKAKYFLYSEEEELNIKHTKFEKRKKAISSLDDLSNDKKKWIATVLFNTSFEGNRAKFADQTLGEYIEKDYKNVYNFSKILAKEDEVLQTEYLIKISIIKNILKMSGEKIYRGDKEIGHNLERAIDYLLNPLKQDERLQIEIELESKLSQHSNVL